MHTVHGGGACLRLDLGWSLDSVLLHAPDQPEDAVAHSRPVGCPPRSIIEQDGQLGVSTRSVVGLGYGPMQRRQGLHAAVALAQV